MAIGNHVKIEIEWDGAVRNPFSLLLSQGVVLKTQVGCSITELLCTHIGIERSYLENRIQTIFLNGEVIDDLETTMVRDHDVLALSAAMPGLAGATLRRGGAYAAMRSNISYDRHRAEFSPSQGVVKIKLFNLVVRELGPNFLAHGITISGADWLDLIERLPATILQKCRSVAVNDHPAEVDQLLSREWRDRTLNLTVRTTGTV